MKTMTMASHRLRHNVHNVQSKPVKSITSSTHLMRSASHGKHLAQKQGFRFANLPSKACIRERASFIDSFAFSILDEEIIRW